MYTANERNMQIKLYSLLRLHPSRFRYAVFVLHPLKWWWSLFQLNSKASSYVYRQTESRPFVAARDTAVYPSHSGNKFSVVSSIFIVISCVLFRCIYILCLPLLVFFRSTFSFFIFFLLGSMAFRPYFAWRRLVSSAIGFECFWMYVLV